MGQIYRHIINRGILVGLMTLFLSSGALSSPIEVKVGGYLFEPFVKTQGTSPSGLTLDLIKLLNSHQAKYQFKFVQTSPKRRYIDFKRNVFDVMFFESKHWGWQKYPINASDVFLKGGEVYITKNKPTDSKQQSYFNDLKSKSLVAILGYHYGFADFNADESTLNNLYKITLVNSPQTIINQILAEKAEVGIVTVSYLKEQLKADKSLNGQLLISKKMDQEYQHTILVREKHQAPSLNEINELLDEISQNGSLANLLAKYGIQPLTQ